MAQRDYYEVLGLDRSADTNQIKTAYRKLALKNHPDRNQDDKAAEERFKEASEAYEVLSDAEKKARYDQYGHAGLEGSFGQGGFQWSDFSRASDFEDIFGDLFGSFFGGGRRRRGPSGPPQGRDLKITLKLSLEEIAIGVEKKIDLSRLQGCDTCSGSGAASGSERQTCSTCGGMGQVQQVSRTLFGQSVSVTACPACSGEGSTVRDPCRSCSGEGRVRSKTTLTVKIPPGVSTGNYIPLRGQGDVGPRGGAPGNCLVFIEEVEHEYFSREGNDVVYRLPVSVSQAVLGDEIEVPTLTAKVMLKVPKGTQGGKLFRMRGKGIPDVDGRGVGDQLVEVVVITPTQLSDRELELYGELGQLEKKKADSEGKSFFEKMWEAFAG
jgi:molecular chaperone DnaJ